MFEKFLMPPGGELIYLPERDHSEIEIIFGIAAVPAQTVSLR
jgi:hypothetical protein